MSEKKHIDRLFQEKFKDFEVSPKEQVWKNIEKELKSKKERKPVILPLWYKIGGAAAVLAIIFLAGKLVFNNSEAVNVVRSQEETETQIEVPDENLIDNNTETITYEENGTKRGSNEINGNVEKEINPTSKNTLSNGVVFQNKEDKENKKSASYTTKKSGILVPKTTTSTANSDENNLILEDQKRNRTNLAHTSPGKKERENTRTTNKKTPEKNRTKVAATSGEEQKKMENQTNPDPNNEAAVTMDNTHKEGHALVSTDTDHSKKNPGKTGGEEETDQFSDNKKSLVEIAATKNKLKEMPEKLLENPTSESSKWQVSPFAAPIYYSGFGSENALDPNLAQNDSEGEISMSYGINFSYKVSERLKIRSGVSQVSMNYQVNNIAFLSTVKPAGLQNVSYNAEVVDIEIASTENVGVPPNEVLGRNPWTPGILKQQLGFIEVPVELEYSLIDKKFGLSIIGGASTLFLNENNLAIKSADGTTNIGEAENLNNMSFSTNIGLGLGYDITKQFEINVEPMFKYQLNAFSENSNGFKPYYLGIYTGFSFKF